MADMNQLTRAIELWSINHELDKSEPSKQFLKVVEELGEVASGMARNDLPLIIDSIGDVYVTLVILDQQHGLNIQDCVDEAYTEIADRVGVNRNGIFIKQEDLSKD